MPGPALRIQTDSVKKALCIAVRYPNREDITELPEVHKDVEHVVQLLHGTCLPPLLD